MLVQHGGTARGNYVRLTYNYLQLFLDEYSSRDRLLSSFKDFPWFRDASVKAIANLQCLGPNHLFWPELDVDLSMNSIKDPSSYPLIAK